MFFTVYNTCAMNKSKKVVNALDFLYVIQKAFFSLFVPCGCFNCDLATVTRGSQLHIKCNYNSALPFHIWTVKSLLLRTFFLFHLSILVTDLTSHWSCDQRLAVPDVLHWLIYSIFTDQIKTDLPLVKVVNCVFQKVCFDTKIAHVHMTHGCKGWDETCKQKVLTNTYNLVLQTKNWPIWSSRVTNQMLCCIPQKPSPCGVTEDCWVNICAKQPNLEPNLHPFMTLHHWQDLTRCYCC